MADPPTLSRPRRAIAPRARAWVLLDVDGAFAAVAARPLSGLTLAVVLALSLAPPAVFLSRVDATAFVERQMKQSGRADQLPAEQRATAVELGAKALWVVLPAGAVVKRGGHALLLAGALLLLLRSLPRKTAPPPFATLVSAAALSLAPLSLKDIALAITMLVHEPTGLDARHALLSNPAAALGLDPERSVGAALLAGLDLFALWACAWAAIGAQVVSSVRSAALWLPPLGLHLAATALAALGAAFA